MTRPALATTAFAPAGAPHKRNEPKPPWSARQANPHAALGYCRRRAIASTMPGNSVDQGAGVERKTDGVYKSLGLLLLGEIHRAVAGSTLNAGGKWGAYETLHFANGASVRFTRWRNAALPYYLVFFDPSGHYIFELDLSMIVMREERFEWALKPPQHPPIRAMLSGWLKPAISLPADYRAAVRATKDALDAGVNTPRIGHWLARGATGDELSRRLVLLARKVLAVKGLSLAVRQAADDEGEVFGTRKLRPQQRWFRLKLLAAYGARCAFSGGKIVETLEAAHIDDHHLSGVNHCSNGLLLRADLHRLFDANLLAVEPGTLRIRVSAQLQNSVYRRLEGKKLRRRTDRAQPGRQYLENKWSRCEFA